MSKKILLVDNEDSFTLNIRDYLWMTGAKVNVSHFASVRKTGAWHNYDALVLGPGPGNPGFMPDLLDFTNSVISRKPLLGICLGFQAIAVVHGVKIVKKEPKHGKIDFVNLVRRSTLFMDIPDRFRVVRYHSLQVEDLAPPLLPNLLTERGELMGFEHENLKISGFQFHPEAHLSEFGMQLLKNWIKML
jgi:anthranilate synthase/aminodeoxychorismate synthase-like glutamine amidotransferase